MPIQSTKFYHKATETAQPLWKRRLLSMIKLSLSMEMKLAKSINRQ